MAELIDVSLRKRLLASIAGDSLVLLCGAGLSMAPPTRLPSAWQIAQDCAAKYRVITGFDLPGDLANNIERLAEHFHDSKELQNVFLGQLINWAEFVRGPTNKGHTTIADFLGARFVALAISTNVDTLIETAASQLGEPDFYPTVFKEDVNRVQNSHVPLLKLHGCAVKSRWDTVWCKNQLNDEPLQTRIQQLAAWMQGYLPNRDLLVVGFWSDWAYLNEILEGAIVSTEPRSVILVDPDTDEALERKSPKMWNWATNHANFVHIGVSGADFLDELRSVVSCHFIRKVWEEGCRSFTVMAKRAPPADPCPALTAYSTDDLYRLRRDLTGVSTSSIVRQKDVNNQHALIGLIHLALLASGATLSSNTFQWNGSTIRVIHTPNEPLSAIANRFSREPPDPSPPTRNVCAGAFDDGGAPANIIQRGVPQGIIRNVPNSQWETHQNLLTELQRAL